jgi:hypothetical protein
MVQMDRVAQIRQQWEASGRSPCAHSDFDREYYLGSNTGDYVCISCGESFSRDEVVAIQQNRK